MVSAERSAEEGLGKSTMASWRMEHKWLSNCGLNLQIKVYKNALKR
jgi:hypothetical protein